MRLTCYIIETLMNVAAIRQGISYVINSKEEKTALQLDLTNVAVQGIVEYLMVRWSYKSGHETYFNFVSNG